MRYTYYLMQSPKGFIDLESAENTEWIQWLLAHGYTQVGQLESDYSCRYLEQGIARSYFQRLDISYRNKVALLQNFRN